MRVLLLVLPWMIACAFAEDAAGAEYVDEDFPPTNCDTDGTAPGCESTGEAPQSCEASGTCSEGVCAASFNGEIGPFECQTQCVPAMDEDQWCFDATACCDVGATCDRGLCFPPDVPATTSDSADTTDGSTDTGTDASTDTGTDTGSTTDDTGSTTDDTGSTTDDTGTGTESTGGAT